MIAGLLISFLVSESAHANCEQNFRIATAKQIEAAKANGWMKIDEIALSGFKRIVEGDGVYVVCVKSLTIDGRKSAVNTPGISTQIAPTIFVNSQATKLSAHDRGLIGTHEFFGALGYDDTEGQLSTRLDLMARTRFSPGDFLNLQLGKSPNNVKASGTSTGVSGGGDSDQLKLKIRMFESYLDSKQDELTSTQNRKKATEELSAFLSSPIRYLNVVPNDGSPRFVYEPRSCRTRIDVGLEWLARKGAIQNLYDSVVAVAETAHEITARCPIRNANDQKPKQEIQ